MKKLTIFFILAIALFISCQKNKPNDDNYYLKFKIDGVDKNYSGYAVFNRDTIAGYITLTIIGANSATSYDDYMGIYLDNSPAGGTIGTGQYDDVSSTYTLLTTHAKNGVDFEAGQSVAEDAAFYNVSLANHFKVNISSMDGQTARGTFGGDYYADGDVQAGTKLSITNGEFFVKFHQ